MHLVLNNYRSGSSRFSIDLARDTKLELYGDLFSDQSLHDTAFVEKFCANLLDDKKPAPMAVVKCHPADVLKLPNGAKILDRLIHRSDKVYMLNRRSFDDILRSQNIADCLKTAIDMEYNAESAIEHTFYVPVTLFEKNYFKILYGTIDLLRVYSKFKNDIELLWYEDVFEKHGRLVRNVVITNPTPPTNIDISSLFSQMQLIR
jgi:hypothetical protein